MSPIYSRIFREMILVTRPGKSFIYTLKQTPKRNEILNQYSAEIDRAYGQSDNSNHPGMIEMMGASSPEQWGLEECTNVARMAVHTVLMQPLRDDMDIFQAGCDSVQATQIRMALFQTLRRAMKVSTRQIPHNFVYFNPTIKRLGTYIAQIVHYGHSSVALAMLSGKISEMEKLALQYGREWPAHRHDPSQVEDEILEGDIVLLTGSTGSLGTYVLEALIKDPTVSRIYALNRQDVRGARTLFVRQSARFKDRGMEFVLNSDKLVLLEGDAAVENLGLERGVYEKLRKEVTCIIHAAWNVNFNVSLSSMEPLIAGTRRLADLALSSPHPTPPSFVFVSSVNVFNNWTEGSIAPESFNSRPATAIGSGYAESKWVAEKILVKASEQTTLRPVIVRIGQICGGLDGSWNAAEWFPTLVASGQVLRCLPQAQGYISWIPAHHAANALNDIRKSLMEDAEDFDDMDIDDEIPESPDSGSTLSSSYEFTDSENLSPQSPQIPPSLGRAHSMTIPQGYKPVSTPPLDISSDNTTTFINLVHPRPIRASLMMEHLSKELGLPLVRYSEWLNALESSAANAPPAPSSYSLSNPAISLLHFYRNARGRLNTEVEGEAFGFTAMKTDTAVETVPWLTSMPQVGPKDVDGWVAYWRKIGLLRQT
ncbi:hypothetical protein VNI00_005470 [Paramarasmius palmivorus]|uniref:Thioester reductase (TE) domain-containing protein n=1 Tax=Paramarasmius palmivorus TaxID=297713 RepID=A0AAW0DBL4_9AGAR